jgi:hypothetical protein
MTSPNPTEPQSTRAPAEVAPAQRKRARWPLIVGVVLLLALLGSGAAYTAINLPRGCGIFGASRHGVPCDVPLPAGATYVRPFSLPGGPPAGVTEQGWVFSVPHTSGKALHDFYAAQLTASGWRCVQDSTAGVPLSSDSLYAEPQYFAGGKNTIALVITYSSTGDTGDLFIDAQDLHAPIGAC